MSRPVRVLVADDQELVRTAFTIMLGSQPDIEVVAEAGDGADAVDLCRKVRPDVAVMDIRMPSVDGVEATRRITAAGLETRVLVLTTFDLDEYVVAALRAGASGFLLKDASAERLLRAVRQVAAGETSWAPTVMDRLLTTYLRGPDPRAAADVRTLTDREREVLRNVAQGLSNDEVAHRLYLSVTTVKTHLARVFAKLGVRDRAQAVVVAYESGLVVPGTETVSRP
ncbi:MAG: response regulator [Nocardioidaceae bacterium]|nr:response regulator transcription factor [Nocardioidaceae bacterium]